MVTWNGRSLADKVEDLTEDLGKVTMDVLGITESKKKGEGEITPVEEPTLIYSGIKTERRAKEGLGCYLK